MQKTDFLGPPRRNVKKTFFNVFKRLLTLVTSSHCLDTTIEYLARFPRPSDITLASALKQRTATSRLQQVPLEGNCPAFASDNSQCIASPCSTRLPRSYSRTACPAAHPPFMTAVLTAYPPPRSHDIFAFQHPPTPPHLSQIL